MKNKVTTNQKHTIDSQKPKEKNMSTTQEKTIKLQKEKERNKEEIQNHLEKRFKMAIKSVPIN